MRNKHMKLITLTLLLLCIAPCELKGQSGRAAWIETYLKKYPTHFSEAFLETAVCNKVLASARKQLKSTKRYDPSYLKLSFPGGDIPSEIGVCADVIVRSLREGAGLDLQNEINIDIKKADSKYPNIWNTTKPDTNIDHRRVPNLMNYFHRHHAVKALSTDLKYYKVFNACDIVAWDLGEGITHIGIVSDKLTYVGMPLVIHHISGTPQEEPVLTNWKIIGHYSLLLK